MKGFLLEPAVAQYSSLFMVSKNTCVTHVRFFLNSWTAAVGMHDTGEIVACMSFFPVYLSALLLVCCSVNMPFLYISFPKCSPRAVLIYLIDCSLYTEWHIKLYLCIPLSVLLCEVRSACLFAPGAKKCACTKARGTPRNQQLIINLSTVCSFPEPYFMNVY